MTSFEQEEMVGLLYKLQRQVLEFHKKGDISDDELRAVTAHIGRAIVLIRKLKHKELW